jgi:ribosomal protein L9
MEFEAAMDTLKERTDKLKQEKQRLLKRKADLVNDIKRLRQELNKKLDDLEKKSINDIEENFKSIVDTIDDCLQQIESKKGDFSISKSKVASSNKNITEVFVNIKLRQNIKREADNFTEEIVMPIIDKDVTFTADKSVSSLFKQLNSFGKVTVKSSNASGNKHVTTTKPMTEKLRPKCPIYKQLQCNFRI